MNLISRRSFLGGITLAAGLGAASCATRANAGFFKSSGLPIGLQLYTLGDMPRNDLNGTLRAVGEIGYRNVQLAGFLGRSPRELKTALDGAGLTCLSAHIAPQLRSGEPSLAGDLGQLAADMHVLGVTTIITPVFLGPDRLDGSTRAGETRGQALARVAGELTSDDWKRNAEFLNVRGAALKREGLAIGYHSHNPEFAPLADGNTGLSLLMAHTDPSLVTFELDVGWATMAGQRPQAVLAEFPGRFTHVHVKDVTTETEPNFAFRQSPSEVGQGVIDWQELLPICYSAGVRSFVVEQDPPYPRPRLDSIRMSFEHLMTIHA